MRTASLTSILQRIEPRPGLGSYLLKGTQQINNQVKTLGVPAQVTPIHQVSAPMSLPR